MSLLDLRFDAAVSHLPDAAFDVQHTGAQVGSIARRRLLLGSPLPSSARELIEAYRVAAAVGARFASRFSARAITGGQWAGWPGLRRWIRPAFLAGASVDVQRDPLRQSQYEQLEWVSRSSKRGDVQRPDLVILDNDGLVSVLTTSGREIALVDPAAPGHDIVLAEAVADWAGEIRQAHLWAEWFSAGPPMTERLRFHDRRFHPQGMRSQVEAFELAQRLATCNASFPANLADLEANGRALRRHFGAWEVGYGASPGHIARYRLGGDVWHLCVPARADIEYPPDRNSRWAKAADAPRVFFGPRSGSSPTVRLITNHL